ncbi:MAG: hypothetical protein IPM80_13215 [Proteobacteria bacterium]|nr:hypothetical protein [Pseudomonadota bacterium]
MFTDLIGFSRHVAEFRHRAVPADHPYFPSPAGAVPGTPVQASCSRPEGDSMLVIFRSPGDAARRHRHARCLSAYNNACATARRARAAGRRGGGYGDVLRIGDADVFGAENNAAAKLGEHRRGRRILLDRRRTRRWRRMDTMASRRLEVRRPVRTWPIACAHCQRLAVALDPPRRARAECRAASEPEGRA